MEEIAETVETVEQLQLETANFDALFNFRRGGSTRERERERKNYSA